MRKNSSPSQKAIDNIRKRLREDMQRIALTHRGCPKARGCGCIVDKALTTLIAAERQLFNIELESYADPTSPRRIVDSDNTVSFPLDQPPSTNAVDPVGGSDHDLTTRVSPSGS